MRPEMMDALASFNRELGKAEATSWEDILSKGGHREDVVLWFRVHLDLLLRLVPLIDPDSETETIAVAEVVLRTHRCLDQFDILITEVVGLTPPPELN